MQYYKNINNALYAFDDNADTSSYVSELGLISISETEYQAAIAPTAEQIKEKNNANILAQISEIEKQQARAIREMLVGATDAIKTTAASYVKQYDDQIVSLRSQLQ